jgi:hypothetical protein
MYQMPSQPMNPMANYRQPWVNTGQTIFDYARQLEQIRNLPANDRTFMPGAARGPGSVQPGVQPTQQQQQINFADLLRSLLGGAPQQQQLRPAQGTAGTISAGAIGSMIPWQMARQRQDMMGGFYRPPAYTGQQASWWRPQTG